MHLDACVVLDLVVMKKRFVWQRAALKTDSFMELMNNLNVPTWEVCSSAHVTGLMELNVKRSQKVSHTILLSFTLHVYWYSDPCVLRGVGTGRMNWFHKYLQQWTSASFWFCAHGKDHKRLSRRVSDLRHAMYRPQHFSKLLAANDLSADDVWISVWLEK